MAHCSALSSPAAVQTPLNGLAAQLEVEVGWRWGRGLATRARRFMDTSQGAANVDHVWERGLQHAHLAP